MSAEPQLAAWQQAEIAEELLASRQAVLPLIDVFSEPMLAHAGRRLGEDGWEGAIFGGAGAR